MQFYDHIVKESIKYNGSKNKVERVTVEKFDTLFSILMYWGHVKKQSQKKNWLEGEDLSQSIVISAITRDRFMTLKSFIIFCCKASFEGNTANRACQLPRLMPAIQNAFKVFGIFDKDFSIDEMIANIMAINH